MRSERAGRTGRGLGGWFGLVLIVCQLALWPPPPAAATAEGPGGAGPLAALVPICTDAGLVWIVPGAEPAGSPGPGGSGSDDPGKNAPRHLDDCGICGGCCGAGSHCLKGSAGHALVRFEPAVQPLEDAFGGFARPYRQPSNRDPPPRA